MAAMCRQDALQPFNKSSKLSQAPQQRSVVFPQTPCGRNFSLLDKSGPLESGFIQISASWRAPPPPASSTRSSVTGTSGNVGSALRLLHSGSCYRCTCAHRTLTGNPTSRRSQGVRACETHCLPSCRLFQPHLGENPAIRGLES